jgi:hypothetical protein
MQQITDRRVLWLLALVKAVYGRRVALNSIDSVVFSFFCDSLVFFASGIMCATTG